MKKEELDWEQKEELKETLKKQKEMAELSEKTAKNYKKFIEQLEKNRAVSKETLEKLKKIQDIMEEISTPELKNAIKEMQKSLQNVTKEQMKQALNNLKSFQEDFLKKLDNTLKLLKKIQQEQNMQKIVQQAQELEKMQKNLNKQTEERMKSNSQLDDLSQKQKDIADKFEKLKEEMEKQIEDLKKSQENKTAEQLEKALEQAMKNKISQNLNTSFQQMQKNNSQNLSETQQSLQKSFSQLTNSLQKAQKMMQGMMQMQFQKLIEKTIFALLYYSKTQEKILDSEYKNFDVVDQEIAMYDGIKNSINNLLKNPLILLTLSPSFSRDAAELYNNFDYMFHQMRRRRTYNIQNDKKKIFTGTNKLILDLLESQGGGQQGGGGMQQLLKQLQQMSKGQSSLNMLTQALFEQMMQQLSQGKGLSAQQKRMVDRLAGNEQRIKENLERILRDFPDAEKLMGNLKSLKDEIKEVIEKLNRGEIDKKLLEKQQHILSRLLDAQRSIHKRDFSRKRKAEIPKQMFDQTPTLSDLTFIL